MDGQDLLLVAYFATSIVMMMMMKRKLKMVITGCTQIPISTLSHVWVFVRLYVIVFVIIVGFSE